MRMDPVWYAHRLRAMSLAEVGHRIQRVVRYPVDRLQMRTGHYARPSARLRQRLASWQGPDPFYVDASLHALPVAETLLAEAEAICAGKRHVLGLGWVYVPADSAHYEPGARDYWPRVDAGRVLRSAPDDLDPRLTWELNRGHEWVVLARVHAATKQPVFLDYLERSLEAWRRSNPIGVGINWASPMEAAIRVHSLVWCAGFLRGNTRVLPGLGEAIYEHAMFVARNLSRYSSANNHLIVELSAVVVAARVLGGSLVQLHSTALGELEREVTRQVHRDGVSAEMATHYHVFVLEALVLVAHLEAVHGHRTAMTSAIRRMAEYLGAIRCADGSLLQQGDSDDGRIVGLFRTDHTDRVLAVADALDVPSPGGAVWLESVTAPVREPRSQLFEASGQVVLRCSRLHTAFDAGPFGYGRLAAHAHCDALSITLAIDGRPVAVDRGTYRYRGGERDAFRLTAAHNTAQLGTQEQATPAGAFLWSRKPTVRIHRCEMSDRGSIVQASHDGFVGWEHRRTLVHHAHVLVIVDELLGGTGLPVTCRLHLAPDVAVEGVTPSWFRTRCAGGPLAWVASRAERTRVTMTPHSDSYARRTLAPTLECFGTSDQTLLLAVGPADVPMRASLTAAARFAAERGVHFVADELAK